MTLVSQTYWWLFQQYWVHMFGRLPFFTRPATSISVLKWEQMLRKVYYNYRQRNLGPPNKANHLYSEWGSWWGCHALGCKTAPSWVIYGRSMAFLNSSIFVVENHENNVVHFSLVQFSLFVIYFLSSSSLSFHQWVRSFWSVSVAFRPVFCFITH
jgi:hypothetical protein